MGGIQSRPGGDATSAFRTSVPAHRTSRFTLTNAFPSHSVAPHDTIESTLALTINHPLTVPFRSARLGRDAEAVEFMVVEGAGRSPATGPGGTACSMKPTRQSGKGMPDEQ